MADAEEKAKAEKLAAAKKRVEQLKKQKAKKAGGKKKEESKPDADADVDTDATPDADASADVPHDDADAEPETEKVSRQRTASISAADIYKKQAARIEELEAENKKLTKDVSDGEKRWRKAEDELEDMREAEKAGDSAQTEKLKSEIAALQRQNTQLQSRSRHGSSPSVANIVPPGELEQQLAAKSSTIESMEMEISNLKAQLDKSATGSSAEKEQITALQDKLARSEAVLAKTQQELVDAKRNLERASEKAVKEGAERSSLEPKLRNLEKENAESKQVIEELNKKVDALEKKAATLTTLHKEHDARSQTQKKSLEQATKEAAELRSKLASLDNENLRLKEDRDRIRKLSVQGDDAGLEELENEERVRLEKQVRELEAEVSELRRGIWSERRRQLDEGATSPSSRFTDVDLGSGAAKVGSPTRQLVGGVGDFFTSGLNAFVSGGADKDELLEDDGVDFDEDAFRRAQEEEALARVARVRELKRGLKTWQGWRLDLVELRRGGGDGVGEIFDV